jgi:hypothetical protein
VDSRPDALGLEVHDDGEGIWHLRPIAISNADLAPSCASLAQDVRLSILSCGLSILAAQPLDFSQLKTSAAMVILPAVPQSWSAGLRSPRLIVDTPAP